jgi:hypothetical protein
LYYRDIDKGSEEIEEDHAALDYSSGWLFGEIFGKKCYACTVAYLLLLTTLQHFVR